MLEIRKGDWMQTASGIAFWPIDPRAEEILISDIAHALSMLCRYGGHCQRFYSVAEHSVLVSKAVDKEHAVWGLLHDASEAYIVDVPRPLKPFLAGYREAEDRVMAAVGSRFGLAGDMPSNVKEIDNRILLDEMRQNMRTPPMPWNVPGEPLGIQLQFWSPEQARAEFMQRFKELTGTSHA